jgi:hypothetical protein
MKLPHGPNPKSPEFGTGSGAQGLTTSPTCSSTVAALHEFKARRGRQLEQLDRLAAAAEDLGLR